MKDDTRTTTRGGRSFGPLFVTNLFGTLNDNFLKTLASFIVIGWISDPSLRPVFMGITAGALVLPFILCSPLADRLTVVFPKRRILQLAKWAEIPIVGIGIAGFAFQSAALVVAAILLMGLQSSLYSPAKYALEPSPRRLPLTAASRGCSGRGLSVSQSRDWLRV